MHRRPRAARGAEFQSFVAAAQATKASNQQWRADIQTERAMETHVRDLRKGVKGIATARFGASGAQMLQFGYSLPKPRKKSAETKAAAVVKGLATRKKRGTMGSVQKKDVKGNVSVELVVTPGPDGTQPVPVVQGAAPAVVATPATPAPPATAAATAPAPAHAGGNGA